MEQKSQTDATAGAEVGAVAGAGAETGGGAGLVAEAEETADRAAT